MYDKLSKLNFQGNRYLINNNFYELWLVSISNKRLPSSTVNIEAAAELC